MPLPLEISLVEYQYTNIILAIKPKFAEPFTYRRRTTVGKKTIRMFVIIQRFLNNSRTIKAMDMKFLGHTVVYVV